MTPTPPHILVPDVGPESMRFSLIEDRGRLNAHVRINDNTVLMGDAVQILSELQRIADALDMAIVGDTSDAGNELCAYRYTTEDPAQQPCVIGTRRDHEDGGDCHSHRFVASGRYSS